MPTTEKRPSMGGQALIEGVMMLSPKRMSMAVRTPSGEIALEDKDYQPIARRIRVLGLPIVRGSVNMCSTLSLGVRTLMRSAELAMDEEGAQETKFEKWLAKKTGKNAMDIAAVVGLVLGICLAVGLFFVLPALAATFIKQYIQAPFVVNLLEGLVRLTLFLAYMLAVSLMPDIRRTFQYHGAEHKVVNCYEAQKPLTVENARSFTTQNPRCGTSFLLIVMVLSLIVYSVLGRGDSFPLRLLSRLILLPVVAGISYELLRLFAKDTAITRILRKPGMWLQKLTTREPDDDMLEVALAAFKSAAREYIDEPEPQLPEPEPAYDGA